MFPRIPPALWIVVGAILLRTAAAAAGPLIDDEAYYWLWARDLAWGYLDQSPMIAYLIFLTTRLGDAPLLVRLGSLLLGLATTYTVFLLGREMFGARTGLIAAALFQVVPVLAGAGLLATPDAPLFLAWIVALRFVWEALHGRPERWPAAGVAVGIGLLSKVSMVLLPVGIGLWLVLRHRHWLRRPEPYVAMLLAVAIYAPVIYWNAQHGWAGLRFLLTERLGGSPLGVTGVLKLLEEQMPFAGALLPAFVWVFVSAFQRPDERFAFLAWTSLPVVVFPFLPAYAGGWPHGNWLGPGYLSLTLALAALWNRPVAALAFVNGAAMLYVLLASIVPLLPLPPGSEEVYGWHEAALRVKAELDGSGEGALIVADRYQVAAQLGYHTRGPGVTVLPCPHPASIWPPPEAFAGKEAVAVIDARWQPVVRWEQYAAAVEEAPALTVELRGRPLRTLRFYRLHGFTTRASCPSR